MAKEVYYGSLIKFGEQKQIREHFIIIKGMVHFLRKLR